MMPQSSQLQPQNPEVYPSATAGPDLDRNRWIPFISGTRGINCQFFTARPWAYFNAANKAHKVYVQTFNAHVAAKRAGNLQLLDDFLRWELNDATLKAFAPFVEAAGDEFRKRQAKTAGPVGMMWLSAQKTVPAIGILRYFLEEIIAAGEVPEEAAEITMCDIIDACFKRHPKGVFMPMVKYRSKLKSNPEHSTWLAENKRHPYSDIGLAVAHDGLRVSILSPKDSRVLVMPHAGMRADRFMDQLDFKYGKEPVRWLIPMDQFLEPHFGETFLSALMKLHIHLRTVVLDASLLPTLPNHVRRTTIHFHQWLLARCADAQVVYDRVPTVGSESRNCRNFFASTGDLTPKMLQGIMAQSSTECPHCRAEILLQTDTTIGAPSNQVETCRNCHTDWEVGLLLAERARVHGAFGWVPEDAYSLS